jgi:hypothetical protein
MVSSNSLAAPYVALNASSNFPLATQRSQIREPFRDRRILSARFHVDIRATRPSMQSSAFSIDHMRPPDLFRMKGSVAACAGPILTDF